MQGDKKQQETQFTTLHNAQKGVEYPPKMQPTINFLAGEGDMDEGMGIKKAKLDG